MFVVPVHLCEFFLEQTDDKDYKDSEQEEREQYTVCRIVERIAQTSKHTERYAASCDGRHIIYATHH